MCRYAVSSLQPNAVFSAFFSPSAALTVFWYMFAPPPKSNGMMVKTSMLAPSAAARLMSRVPHHVGPGGAGAERDDRLDARVVLLDDLQRVEDAVLDGLVLELVGVLDVDVDGLEVVRVDDLLVGAGQRLRASRSSGRACCRSSRRRTG